MIEELNRLRELTEKLTGNGYLRNQADEWEYALDAIPDYIYIVNNKFEIKFINKSLAERLGSRKDNLFNKICFDVITGDEKNCPPESWATLDRRNVHHNLECVFLPKLKGWFNLSRSPIYTKANKLIGFICVLQDISEQKLALEKIQEREAMLDTVFNSAPIGIGLLDVGTRSIIDINKFLEELLGYNSSEVKSHPFRMFFPTTKDYDNIVKSNIAVEDDSGTETRLRTKNGDILEVHIRSAYIKNNSSVLVFTVADITERKKIERALERNRRHYKLMLDNVSDAIWSMDVNMNFTFVNPVIEELMGYSPVEWVGHNISEFSTESDFNYMAKQVCNALSDPEFSETKFQTKMLNKRGENVSIEISAKPLYDKRNNIVGFQGVTKLLDKKYVDI